MHVCGFFLLRRAGKNNVMAKWCAAPLVLSPTQPTLVDPHLGSKADCMALDASTGKPNLLRMTCLQDGSQGCRLPMPVACSPTTVFGLQKVPKIPLSHVSTLSLNLLRPPSSSSVSHLRVRIANPHPPQPCHQHSITPSLPPHTLDRTPQFLAWSRSAIGQSLHPLTTSTSISAPSLLNPSSTSPPQPIP